MTASVADLITEARGRVENLTPAEFASEMENGTVVFDLREPNEAADSGMIEGAILAPRGMLEFWADPRSAYHWDEFDPDSRTLLYCASGGRSALAADTLRKLGYGDVAHLDGGVKGWIQAGLPTVKA